MNKIIILFFLTFHFLAFSQNEFKEIDSVSKNIAYNGDIEELVLSLTHNLKNDIEKTRAIYIWITENIEYDYKSVNKKKRAHFKCKGKNCHIKEIQFINNLINKVLRKRKGVCSGYSLLFEKMCSFANIKTLYIEGYIKTKPNYVGKLGILDHAWNAIIINNQIHFIDLTWAAGYCEKDRNEKLTKFIKQRNDFYWFTPVEKFSINHYPEKPEKIPTFYLTKEEYKNQPYIDNNIISKIEIEKPKNGILNTFLKDTIKFKFSYPKQIEEIQINTNLKRNPKVYRLNDKNEMELNERAYKRQKFIKFIKKEDTYEFYYVVENKNLRYIEILFDFNIKIKYLVKIKTTKD